MSAPSARAIANVIVWREKSLTDFSVSGLGAFMVEV